MRPSGEHMKYYLLPLSVILTAMLSPCVQAETTLTVTTSAYANQQAQLNYSAPVRIEQTLEDGLAQLQNTQAPASKTQPVYWLGAALIDMQNTAALEKKRQSVLTQLRQMGANSDDSQYISKLAQLAQFIRNIHLGQRVFQPLDRDHVRITAKHNPLLDGRFMLVLPPRPHSITVVGAVSKMGDMTWLPQASSQDYLEKAYPLENADNSYVWIIQPDGHALKHPIAYWNAKQQDIAPGATIFVSYAATFENYDTLNDNIIELLRNRTL